MSTGDFYTNLSDEISVYTSKGMLSGYKTYIVCAVAVIYAVAGFYTGNLDLNAAIQVVLAALGAAGLRHGITTSSQ